MAKVRASPEARSLSIHQAWAACVFLIERAEPRAQYMVHVDCQKGSPATRPSFAASCCAWEMRYERGRL